jgi:hypothetical protein
MMKQHERRGRGLTASTAKSFVCALAEEGLGLGEENTVGMQLSSSSLPTREKNLARIFSCFPHK